MTLPLISLIYVAAFMAVVLTVQVIGQIVMSAHDQKQKVNRRLTMLASGVEPEKIYKSLVRKPLARSGMNPLLVAWIDRLSLYCRQAGLEMDIWTLLRAFLAIAAALWILSLLVMRPATLSAVVLNGSLMLAASAGASALIVWFWLSRERKKRRRALEEEMPLALDVIVRALRAGHPVVSAVQLAANELGDPIGSEFGLIVDETTYGSDFREALVNFARRTGSSDAHFFAVSVGIQSETGGNLAEALSGLAVVIRGRQTLAKRVKAVSSEGRASALLLSVLPVALVVFMMVVRPEYYTAKFADPIFWPTVFYTVTGYLIGWFMIHRIINFKY